MPLETPVIPKVPASDKIQLASEPEEPVFEGVLSTVDLGKSRVSRRMVPTKGKRAHAQSSRVLRPEVDFFNFVLVGTISQRLFFSCRRSVGSFDESDDEGMTDLLKAMTSPLSTAVK